MADDLITIEEGQFADLPAGRTHYVLQGPEDGQVLVFVHGFGFCHMAFRAVATQYAEKGHRTLVYDLLGRGLSAPPRVRSTPEAFADQLEQLLTHLGLDAHPFTLVGFSMGGGISLHYAQRHPDIVKRLMLVASVGFPVCTPWTAKLVKLPLIGELAMKLVGRREIVRAPMRDVGNLEKNGHIAAWATKVIEWQLRVNPNYMSSILDTLRSFDFGSMESIVKDVGQSPRPVLLFWGEEDAVVPFKNTQQFLALMPRARLVHIPHAGHAGYMEEPEVFSRELDGFLQEN